MHDELNASNVTLKIKATMSLLTSYIVAISSVDISVSLNPRAILQFHFDNCNVRPINYLHTSALLDTPLAPVLSSNTLSTLSF